jgi:hypothetical protein
VVFLRNLENEGNETCGSGGEANVKDLALLEVRLVKVKEVEGRRGGGDAKRRSWLAGRRMKNREKKRTRT